MTEKAGQAWFRENASRFSGELRLDEPLSRHTYYRIGGPADVLVVPKTLDDLRWIAEGLRETGFPVFVLGAGSNLLVSDGGYRGVVVAAKKLNTEIRGPDPRPELGKPAGLRTGASVLLSSLLRKAGDEGWGGFEMLAGIPGSVGGAAVMNAGTHLGESKDLIRRVEVIHLTGADAGRPVSFEGAELRYAYRRNGFIAKSSVVWAVDWEATQSDPALVRAAIDSTLARRKATQPVDSPSCGSVFKNPRQSGLSAWQVIDRLGLRGHRIGHALFSEKHCNFILNDGGAAAADVKGLIDLAKRRAAGELGIELEEEVIYLGG